MKILFVVRDMFMGGAGKQLALTTEALINKGHEITIYTYIGKSLEHQLEPRINYIPAEQTPKNKFEEYFCSIYHLRKIIRKLNVDVVVGWRANAGCIARISTLGTKVPCIFSERTDPYMETNILLKVATYICNYSDGGIFQTDKAREYYKRLKNKSVVIPNFIDIRNTYKPIKPITERRKEIVWVGRFFNQQKRIDIALKAMSIIHKVLPDYTFNIYGDGDDRKIIEDWIVQYGLTETVVLHGASNNVPEIIRGSRLLILSSDYEGIPNVIIEAFSSGTPVVSTDCSPGGARFLIDSGHNGFIVPIRDYKALADKSIELIEDDVKSTEFVKNARQKLTIFEYNKLRDVWSKYLTGYATTKCN